MDSCMILRRGYLPIVLGGDRVASSPCLLPIQALFGSKTFESDLGMRLVIRVYYSTVLLQLFHIEWGWYIYSYVMRLHSMLQ